MILVLTPQASLRLLAGKLGYFSFDVYGEYVGFEAIRFDIFFIDDESSGESADLKCQKQQTNGGDTFWLYYQFLRVFA